MLRASTLVETLVMMLVAGILFLTVMEGLTLFSRLQARRAEALLCSGRTREGYLHVVDLLTSADSIHSSAPGRLSIYRRGQHAELALSDSLLIYRRGAFSDTLLSGVGVLRLTTHATYLADLTHTGSALLARSASSFRPDTVEIGFGAETGARFTAKFAVEAPAEQYRLALDQIEQAYVYEE